MNSVFNGKIAELTPFEESFISSCPDDSGTASAPRCCSTSQRTGRKAVADARTTTGARPTPTRSAWRRRRSIGCPTSRSSTIRRSGPPPTSSDGRILGWFQGRMEFGQRALGHRSILLDPRRPDGKDVVNSAIKFREAFRPFAPAILAERVAEWFEAPTGTGCRSWSGCSRSSRRRPRRCPRSSTPTAPVGCRR